MCGRFMLVADEGDVRLRFNVGIYDESYRPRYNCAPSQPLAIITNNSPSQLSFFRWGLHPAWAKNVTKPINARAETLSEKPMFREAFKHRRCLVPANGYYEWTQGKAKKPFLIQQSGGALFAMAGIFEEWQDAAGIRHCSFAIVTTDANTLTSSVHPRMPLILNQEHEHIWLGDASEEQLLSLLKPFPASEMQIRPLSSLVNSVRNDFPEILNPPPKDLFD